MTQVPTCQPESREHSAGALPIRDLVARAQAGSRPAFVEIVARFHGRVYNFLLRRTASRADAEDLSQETFVQAWLRIGRYRARWEFSTWLFTIAARKAATHNRRARRRPAEVVTSAEPATARRDDPARVASDRENGRRLWEAAERVLSARQRSALWLRYAENLSPGDIAVVLGTSRVSVRVLRFRARAVLAAELGPAEAPVEAPGESPGESMVGETSW